MPKETITIDSRVLQPLREIAGILGVPPKRYIEGFRVDPLMDQWISSSKLPTSLKICTTKHVKRQRGQPSGFEKFVIEMELGCIPKTSTIVGTIATGGRFGIWIVVLLTTVVCVTVLLLS